MAVLRVSLLGRLQIQCDGCVLDDLDSRKAQELFCYLLVHRHRSHAREALASFLWADVSTSNSRKYLRQAIWQLQHVLQRHLGRESEQVVQVEAEWIGIHPDADVWVDVAQLEKAYADTQMVYGDQLDAGQVRAVEAAVQLYQGDLLEGWYQDWCIYERERCQRVYLILLDKLLAYFTAVAAYEAGLRYGMEILRWDRARERTHRHLMRLYYLAGDRTAALRQYDLCVQTLADELDVAPAQSTQRLYAQICADRYDTVHVAEPASRSQAAPGAAHDVVAPADFGEHLRQLQANLFQLQAQVEACIQSFQHVVKRHS